MTLCNYAIPPLVEQAAVLQHALLVPFGYRLRQRRAPQVPVGTQALIGVSRHLQPRISDPIAKVGLVPFGGHKGLIERADLFQAGAADDPWADHDVNLHQPQPVERCWPDGTELPSR